MNSGLIILIIWILAIVIIFIIGLNFILKNKQNLNPFTIGTIKVDRSDPEKDKFLLELDIDPIEVLKYDKIMLKVVEINKKENIENK